MTSTKNLIKISIKLCRDSTQVRYTMRIEFALIWKLHHDDIIISIIRQIWHIFVHRHMSVCGGDFSKDFVWIRVWSLNSPATLSQPPLWVNFQRGSSTDCSNLLVNLNWKSHRGQMYTTRHIVKFKILSFLTRNICEAGSFKNSASYKVLV